MTDSEKIETLRQYIASRRDYLGRLIYHHQCNIPEPTMSEQYDYAAACGEHDALCRLRDFFDGGIRNLTDADVMEKIIANLINDYTVDKLNRTGELISPDLLEFKQWVIDRYK